MKELNRLLRDKLKALAVKEAEGLKQVEKLPYRKGMAAEEAEDDVIALGCFIPGGPQP